MTNRNALTSWKEIAQYLGKGVRTVQRWEEAYGLPVRRLRDGDHKAIVALPHELDAWLRAHNTGEESEVDRLRRELATLRAENAQLRQWLTLHPNHPSITQHQELMARSAQLRAEMTAVGLSTRDTIARTHSLLAQSRQAPSGNGRSFSAPS